MSATPILDFDFDVKDTALEFFEPDTTVIEDKDGEDELEIEPETSCGTRWEGRSTAEICDHLASRVGAIALRRAAAIREFGSILRHKERPYPIDGVDYKALVLLCDPDLTKHDIADRLGRSYRDVTYIMSRIRRQWKDDKIRRTKDGRGVMPDVCTEPAAAVAWITAPLPRSRGGRKKKVVVAPVAVPVTSEALTTEVLILAPVLAPEPASVLVKAWGTKRPRVKRIRTPDFTAPQKDFGSLFGEGWGIPPPTPYCVLSGIH